MKEKILFYARKAFVFFIAAVSLLTLCFTFIKISETSSSTVETTVNGFNLLPFGRFFDDGEAILYAPAFFSILITSICLIVISIINFFVKGGKLDVVVIVLAMLIAICYMCFGITQVRYTLLMYAEIETSHIYYSISTVSYVPFIIQVVLTAFYVLLVVLSVNVFKQKAIVGAGNTVATTSYIDDLKQLKELFDTDVINQEEFDAKKKEILGL